MQTDAVEKMNILQVMGCSSIQYASTEKYLVEKAKTLSKRGYKFFLVYEDIPKSRRFIRDFLDAGGKLYEIRLRNFFNLSNYRKIYRIIKEEDIEIVHSYFSPVCHYLSIYLTIRGFKNLVRTAANLPVSIRISKKWRNSYLRLYFSFRHKLLSLFVRKIMCRSEGVKLEYQELGISTRKLSVVSGGLDIENYKFSSIDRDKVRRKYDINNETLVLGTFCRLASVKRIDRLIKSFNSIKINDRDIKLLIAGDGPELENLKRLVRNFNLNEKIKLLGHRNDISELYSALDIFCLPSIAEGMSNSILEAMASELPVVATYIVPNKELIDDGIGGFLISFEDEKEFQDRIEKLLDIRLRREMGKHNREKAISKFSLKSRIEKEFQIYKEIFY